MNPDIAREIQDEQDHGRSKYGNGPFDLKKDDRNSEQDWHDCISDHNRRAVVATTMDRRQHLIKVAGMAVSAIEAIDRKISRRIPRRD